MVVPHISRDCCWCPGCYQHMGQGRRGDRSMYESTDCCDRNFGPMAGVTRFHWNIWSVDSAVYFVYVYLLSLGRALVIPLTCTPENQPYSQHSSILHTPKTPSASRNFRHSIFGKVDEVVHFCCASQHGLHGRGIRHTSRLIGAQK